MPLHRDTQHPSGARTHTQRRNEDPRGDLDAESDYSQRALDDHGDEDRARDGPDGGERAGVDDAEAGVGVAGARATFGEEVVDELGAAHAGVGVEEAEARGDEGGL